jgi:hypothetical protein
MPSTHLAQAPGAREDSAVRRHGHRVVPTSDWREEPTCRLPANQDGHDHRPEVRLLAVTDGMRGGSAPAGLRRRPTRMSARRPCRRAKWIPSAIIAELPVARARAERDDGRLPDSDERGDRRGDRRRLILPSVHGDVGSGRWAREHARPCHRCRGQAASRGSVTRAVAGGVGSPRMCLTLVAARERGCVATVCRAATKCPDSKEILAPALR